jgi:hypothetical protein
MGQSVIDPASPNAYAGFGRVTLQVSKYRLYVDESGNSDLGQSDDPNHRFLSLTGIIIDLDYVRDTMHPEMEALKRRYFESHPDEPIIFHRHELVYRSPPFEALSDLGVQYAFNQDLLRCLREWEYRVITVCLDKKGHVEAYGIWRRDPYHYCMAVLLERFNFWLRRRGTRGDVMAESRGGKEDRRLKDSFRDLWSDGTQFVNPEQFQSALTSREIKIKTKVANVAGLQLADLIAHPSRTEILAEQGLLGREIPTFAARIIEILEHKYDQGRVYGKKFL